MTALQRVSLATLLVGLIAAALIVPWSMKTIERATASIVEAEKLRADLESAPVPTPDTAAAEAARAQALEQAAARRAATEQAQRIKASLDALAFPKPVPPPAAPTPRPAYSFAAPGPELMPLEGWVDQPNKDRPGRVHTNLMVRHVKPTVKPRTSSRAPCLVMTAKPAERIERPYGWLHVPARTIPVPCGS